MCPKMMSAMLYCLSWVTFFIDVVVHKAGSLNGTRKLQSK